MYNVIPLRVEILSRVVRKVELLEDHVTVKVIHPTLQRSHSPVLDLVEAEENMHAESVIVIT